MQFYIFFQFGELLPKVITATRRNKLKINYLKIELLSNRMEKKNDSVGKRVISGYSNWKLEIKFSHGIP